ncbi:MAG: hypothetical protein LUE86_12835 [Clostridiales bacterium]|nr:hypothetical protein [Clostridiales bacterium]
MISLLLFETILELFLILMMGFALVRLHVLESADSKSLSVLSLYLIAPCALISSFQITFTDEIGKQLLFSLCLGVVIHILLFVIVAILGRLFHLNNLEQASLI